MLIWTCLIVSVGKEVHNSSSSGLTHTTWCWQDSMSYIVLYTSWAWLMNIASRVFFKKPLCVGLFSLCLYGLHELKLNTVIFKMRVKLLKSFAKFNMAVSSADLAAYRCNATITEWVASLTILWRCSWWIRH